MTIEEQGNAPCPFCGCEKPKTLVDGRYQCADCECLSDDDCRQSDPV